MESTIKTSIKKTEKIVNVRLSGREMLLADLVTLETREKNLVSTVTGKVLKELEKDGPKEVKREVLQFPLGEIPEWDIEELRMRKVPSLLLKENGKYYYAEIDRRVNCGALNHLSNGNHMCENCRRLSAASDELGGCEKVRKMSRRIERFPFISVGLETFSVNTEVFVVEECANWGEYAPVKKMSTGEITDAKLAIAQYVYPEAKTLEEVRRKMRKEGI